MQKDSREPRDIQQKVSLQPSGPGFHYLPPKQLCIVSSFLYILPQIELHAFFLCKCGTWYTLICSLLFPLTTYLRSDYTSTHINRSYSFKNYKLFFMNSFFDCLWLIFIKSNWQQRKKAFKNSILTHFIAKPQTSNLV